MRTRTFTILLALILSACHSESKHPAADTVAMRDTMDSVGTDSTLLDQHTIPTDVEDTTGALYEPTDSAISAALNGPGRRTVGGNVGMGYGLTNYDVSQWCSGPLTATMLQITPANALGVLKLAAKCQVRVVLVPSRAMITVHHRTHDPFSLTNANAFSDDLCRVLTPTVLDDYGQWLIGLNLADDYGSPDQWGGTIVTQAQIGAWAAHTRNVCGSKLRLGLRVEPSWAKGHPEVITPIDWTWAQYRKRKGDAKRYFDANAALAKQLGLKVVMGVNVAQCDVSGSAPCTPSELQTFGTIAVTHPDNCLMVNWKIDERPPTYSGTLRDIHLKLLAKAKARPLTTCRKES